MTGFDRRLKELLEKVRLRAEAEGIQWRKADKDVYAFRAGPYVITFAKERDPLVAIYDENGEELEAIDRADLEGRTGPDGRLLIDVKARIWRLARRGAGASAEALDRVLDWLDERVDDNGAPLEGAAAPREDAGAPAEIGQSEFSLQAPQAGAQTPEAVVAQGPGAPDEPERREEPRHSAAPNGGGHSGIRPPWAQ